jgi:hypothetical protein
MNSEEKEVYEITDNTVDNFDQLNEKYRNNTDWIVINYNKIREKI